jgi:hypothetical protein
MDWVPSIHPEHPPTFRGISLFGRTVLFRKYAALDGQLSYRRQPIGLLTLSVNYNRIRLPEPYASADIWLIGPRFEVSPQRFVPERILSV